MFKKLVFGEQSPHQGCRDSLINEVRLETNTDCPMVCIRAGPCGKPFRWLIDSGAKESVIDSESYREMFPGSNLEPMKGDIQFRSADGSPLTMLGSFSTEFWFDSLPITATVFVCRGVTKTRLIGVNVLSQFDKWGVDNRSRYFNIGKTQIPLVSEAMQAPNISAVTLARDISVPPRCGCVVPVKLANRFKPSELLFKPDKRVFYKRQLLMPVCLVSTDFFDGTAMIRVTNPTEEEVHVHKGTKVGQVFDTVAEFDIVAEENYTGESGINSVQMLSDSEMEGFLKKEHEELYNLFKQSCEGLNKTECSQLLQILYKFQHVFSRDDTDIGRTNIIKHKIIPKSDKIVYRRQYRHSEEQHKQIDEEVEKLLKMGVVRESMSPFNNPVLMVPKKEKGKWRFCLDCRYINDLTEDQYFPIPRIDDAIGSLAGATVFSVLDQTSGYHQVDLDEETSAMCAFSTRKGHYQYARLPMGLRGSGMTFQKMVTLLLSGMLHTEILAYLDDCILYGNSNAQHMVTLEEVLKRFGNANLKLKPRKCKLFRQSIVYLGYLIDSSGVRPNPEVVELIKNLPEPTNVTGVQMFLGKANYYRKFIPNLADIAHPLYELIKSKGKVSFKWEAEHQVSFDQIKSILTSGQVMAHPRTDREFVLDVDASDYALGVELSQADENGDLRPIFYGSRHLEKSERAYSATARETLAAVFGCEYFREYLHGRKFVLRSDHNPLVWLRRMKEPKRPYSGWIIRLEQFEYKIVYRPGKDHTNADFNSRISSAEEQADQLSVGTQTEMDVTVTNGGGKDDTTRTAAVSASIPLNNSECDREISLGSEMNQDSKGVGDDPSNAAAVNRVGDEQEVVNLEEDASVGESPSRQLLSSQQAEDKDIGPVIKKLCHPEEEVELTEKGMQLWKVRKRLFIKDGLLTRLHRLHAGLDPIEQVVLPACLKEMVLESLHDSPFCGHFGEKRTKVRVQLRYYWPGYLSDTEEWCRTCETCQQRKPPQSKNQAPLTSIDTGSGPFEQVALDILKLPLTARGNEYLLVVEDFFSKWVEAFPLQRTVAPSVAQCVLNGWISRFGCPYTILSDQGREFESKLFKSLSEMLQMKKLRTTTYHPRTDGMVERSNRTIIDVLSKYCEKEPDWDLKLPLVLFAIRTSEHATTGFSPFNLVYGQEARLPWDIVYGQAPNTPMPHEHWVADRKKHMTKVFEMVKDLTSRRQLQQKRYFDSKQRGKFQTFVVGELVMYCDPAARKKQGKLNKPWFGPYEVVGKISESLYKVKMQGGEKVVNTERLKKYYERSHMRRRESADSDEVTPVAEHLDDEESSDDELQSGDESLEDEDPPQDPQPALNQLPGNQQHRASWGNRGELRCNIDPGNIIQGRRNRL